MLVFIIIVYLVVAVVGIYMLSLKLSGKYPKLLTGIIHGALGLFGIACMIFYISFLKEDSPFMSILLFIAALLIGGGILSANLFKKKYPLWLAVVHALTGAAGIYLLIEFWIK